MPKLSDAINKVNQEEAQRKRPVKRRPYLDNIAPLEVADNFTVIKTKHSNSVVVEQIPEILQAQISVNEKTLESKSQFSHDGERLAGEPILASKDGSAKSSGGTFTKNGTLKASEVGEKPKTSLPYFAKKEFKTIPNSHGKSAEEIILKSKPPLEEVDNIEEVFEVDVESQSFDFLSPPPKFPQEGRNWDAPATHKLSGEKVWAPKVDEVLEGRIPSSHRGPEHDAKASIDKKLKPITSYLSEELLEPTTPKVAEKNRLTPPTPPIRNSQTHVNPKGTMGTDEEDGVDLSIYNLEQFGHTTKTVLFYIFRKAKENKCLVTPPLKKTDLQRECGINFNTIKSVLQRLSHYKFIKLEKFQRGPFGWTRYSIRESLYNQLLYNYDGLIPTQRLEKPTHQYTENNYTEVGEDITLPDTLKEIGFNMGHVNQLKKMPMTADKIQNSLDAFAFDMQDKEFKQKIRSPLAVFMKVAKTEGEYISSRGYISPEDEIMQQMITLKKDRAIQVKKQQDELLNLSFNEWLSTKSREEIIKIAPPSGDYLGPLHKAELKNWYQENVFQE